MSANHEEPVGNQTLAEALLAIDGPLPRSSARGREIAQQALRRDRRRVRILTGVTIGFFLVTVFGVCFLVYFYYLKIAPAAKRCASDISVLEKLLDERHPKPNQDILLETTAGMTMAISRDLFLLESINIWGAVAALAVMWGAAVCTVLLVTATRRATLRQIQASLLVLSEQLGALQQSLQTSPSASSGSATQKPNG